MHQVFFVSDHTGVTVEVLGRSLLARFAGLDARLATRPFVDSVEKARHLVEELGRAPQPPIVFTSITAPEVLAEVRRARALVLDVVEPFLGRIAEHVGQEPQIEVGAFHAVRDVARYQRRIAAVEFALATDDGLGVQHYGDAEIILVGVSRAGKTPTSLYLALHHGVSAANYPFTTDDGEDAELPTVLRPHRERLFGLTIDPERLQQIRRERRPEGAYASIERCRRDVALAEAIFRRHGVPTVNTTVLSVEEIAARILHRDGGRTPGHARRL
jgi:[pyruvate, water dikinase]-phosphate phosphotransferase / [pyruvate, water dikinase] kinase